MSRTNWQSQGGMEYPENEHSGTSSSRNEGEESSVRSKSPLKSIDMNKNTIGEKLHLSVQRVSDDNTKIPKTVKKILNRRQESHNDSKKSKEPNPMNSDDTSNSMKKMARAAITLGNRIGLKITSNEEGAVKRITKALKNQRKNAPTTTISNSTNDSR